MAVKVDINIGRTSCLMCMHTSPYNRWIIAGESLRRHVVHPQRLRSSGDGVDPILSVMLGATAFFF